MRFPFHKVFHHLLYRQRESGSVIQKLLVVKTEDLNLIAFLYWALLYLVTFLNLAFTYHLKKTTCSKTPECRNTLLAKYLKQVFL